MLSNIYYKYPWLWSMISIHIWNRTRLCLLKTPVWPSAFRIHTFWKVIHSCPIFWTLSNLISRWMKTQLGKYLTTKMGTLCCQSQMIKTYLFSGSKVCTANCSRDSVGAESYSNVNQIHTEKKNWNTVLSKRRLWYKQIIKRENIWNTTWYSGCSFFSWLQHEPLVYPKYFQCVSLFRAKLCRRKTIKAPPRSVCRVDGSRP